VSIDWRIDSTQDSVATYNVHYVEGEVLVPVARHSRASAPISSKAELHKKVVLSHYSLIIVRLYQIQRVS
jgi:hypothetical protein